MAFSSTERRKRGFRFLHFQSLVVIENGRTSVCRAGGWIFRAALKESFAVPEP
jgi:hypothetical protein